MTGDCADATAVVRQIAVATNNGLIKGLLFWKSFIIVLADPAGRAYSKKYHISHSTRLTQSLAYDSGEHFFYLSADFAIPISTLHQKVPSIEVRSAIVTFAKFY